MARLPRELEWPVQLDRDAPRPLCDQLVEQLREAILSGQAPPGAALPSTRGLARALGISRTTTFNAYMRLLSEGYLTAAHGSSTRISLEAPAPPRAPRPTEPASAPRWLRHPPLAPFDLPDPPLGAIAFRAGATTMPTASLARWRSAVRQAAREPLPTRYGAPEGDLEFRAAIAAYLGRARGLACAAEDVIITSGTMRGLDLLLQAALLPGDLFGVEEPGYPMARQVARARGLTLALLPADGQGLRVAELPLGSEAPQAIYVTPSHQYPLGGRLPVGRRLALLEWASAQGALVIEDDYDSEFRFDAPPLPALAALDTTRGQVAYLGTFSKVLTPAVRCGYLVAPPPLRARVIQLALATEFHPGWLIQRALTRFMRAGRLEAHIQRMRRHYARLRALLARELAPLEPHANLCGLEAGLHAVLELPFDPAEVIAEARAKGVIVGSLDEYYAGRPQARGLMLAYGGLGAEELTRATRLLVEVIAPRLAGKGTPTP